MDVERVFDILKTEKKISKDEIVKFLSMDDINVDRFISLNDNKENIYEIDVYVYNIDHLNKGFRDLEKLQYVTKVERVIR